jgi:peptidoglycan/xylan/chitin deacetylase (PgdA/CDA1 family)
MVLAVLAPLVGLLVLSTVSVYLQPRFIVNLIARAYPEVVFSVTTTEKIIALTIDDAPTRLDTPAILDILRENNVRATFFCIGYNIITEDSDREILTRMANEGHELGNHMSFDSPSYQLNDTEFTKQFLEVDELLHEIKNTSEPPDDANTSKWFRPGHGFFTRKMVDKVQSYGYRTALGDVYPHDPAIALSSVNAFYVINRVHPGAIIILHNRPWSVDTIATIVPKLKAMGYTFATLSELIKYDTTPRTIPLIKN